MKKANTIHPTYSVIIPMYNSELYISSTITSVLKQTFKNFELLIINDGSTDNSTEIVNQFNDTRIKLITKANGGVSSARNRGIKEAKGEYIAFLDSDDYWHPNHLEFASKYLSINNNIVWYTSSQKNVNQITLKKEITLNNKFQYLNFFAGGIQFISSSNVIIKRNIVVKADGFPENIKYGEDTVFWYKIGLMASKLGYSPITTVQILKHPQSATACLKRSNDYIFECIKARKGKVIKNDLALQGIILSMLLYNYRHKDFKAFIELFKLIKPILGLKLSIRTIIQIPYALLLRK